MKKLLLLLTMGSIGLAASAQHLRQSSTAKVNPHKMVQQNEAAAQTFATSAVGHKGTLPAFYTQDFNGGIPMGWTSTGGWHHTTVASTSAYHLAALASTTASNGWMIFDSDSLGTACSCAPTGYLQSAPISCTGHTSVRLNFQELYRSFYDSCVIWVSTSSTFGSYTRYPIATNAGLSTNSSTANPETVHINITTAAASQPTVYIRFVYYGYNGGSYSWNIDDVNLTELDPHDVSIRLSSLVSNSGVYGSSIFNTPLQFVDPLDPLTVLTNEGANAEVVPMSVNIYNGTTSVYSQTTSVSSLPVGFQDSVIEFGATTPFTPSAVGSYYAAFAANLATDADMTNNYDTVFFNVTDTTWSQLTPGSSLGSYYVHRASPALSYMQGARFDIPASAAPDTISGFGVAFSSSSAATGAGKVAVQLFSLHDGETSWTFQGTSVYRSLTAADYSTSTGLVWAYFPIDVPGSGGWSQLMVQPSTTYAAVIQTNGVTSDLLVYAANNPVPAGWAGYFGQADSSYNTGSISDFGATLATGLTSTPAVRLYFGHPSTTLSVGNVNAAALTSFATPNPASDEVKIAFNKADAAEATINITNSVGQVVATQTVNGVSNGTVTFNTAALPAGVYFYSVLSNGVRSTGRIAVAH